MADQQSTPERTGGCQCGEVRYVVRGEPIALAVCHCSECKRQSGSAFGMSLVVPREAFALTAGDPKVFTRTADRGGTVDCFFCPNCGARIYHASTNMSLSFNVKAGSLDDMSWLEPSVQVFTKRRLSWVQIPNDVPSLESGPPAAPAS